MRKILSVVLLGMLITLSAACGGGGGSSNDTEPPTPKTYSITGRITANSESLAEVTVLLNGASTASTTTDASGNYSFAELDNGDYTVTLIFTGYTFSPSSTAVTVSGADQTDIDFTATASTTPTYTISGKVSGASASGVTIYLTGASNASTITDSSGNYNFVEIANGDYTVTPIHTGYTFSPSSTAVTVSGADQTDIDFTATASTTPTYTISGTVSGAVVSDVTITLSGTGSITITTDASGNYSFSNASNGSYTITPSKTGYTFSPPSRSITVNSANVTGQNFTATASTAPTYSISGTVSGAVALGVTITITGTGSRSTLTDASGNYSFSGAANGSYTITPSKTGYTFSPANRSITVNNANVTGQNFTATTGQPTSASCGSPIHATVFHPTGWAAHWSHVAKAIAYNDLGTDGYYHIHLMDEDRNHDRVFGTGIAGFPSRTVGSPFWHPSGKYLAFVAEKPEHPGSSFEATPGWGSWSDLWIAAVDESGVWQLTDMPVDSDHGTLIPIFSQDGRHILWTERTVRANPLSLNQFAAYWVLRLADISIDLDGPHLSNIRTIKPGAVDSFTESGGFSLDGRSLLLTSNFESGNFFANQIYRYDIASGELTRLTDLGTYNEHPRFTPDGRIIWMTDKNHTLSGADWWVMSADGDSKTQLSFFNVEGHPESDGSPRWVGPVPIENWSEDRSYFLGDVEYDLLTPRYTLDRIALTCVR